MTSDALIARAFERSLDGSYFVANAMQRHVWLTRGEFASAQRVAELCAVELDVSVETATHIGLCRRPCGERTETGLDAIAARYGCDRAALARICAAPLPAPSLFERLPDEQRLARLGRALLDCIVRDAGEPLAYAVARAAGLEERAAEALSWTATKQGMGRLFAGGRQAEPEAEIVLWLTTFLADCRGRGWGVKAADEAAALATATLAEQRRVRRAAGGEETRSNRGGE